MLAFILPLGCRIDSRARVLSISARPMFLGSQLKTSFSRLSPALLPYGFFVMQSDSKQPVVQTSSDEGPPSNEATSSTSIAGLAVVEDESRASERSAAWGDTIMHVMLTALAITVSLQARRRLAAALLACLSAPQLLKLGHRLKIIPPSLYPLFPPPGGHTTPKRALPAATEALPIAPSVSEDQLSSIHLAVDSLKETISSRDMTLATTLATLDSNLAAVRDTVRTLAPAATPTAPFAHMAEVQILRARLARAEEARDAVQARLAASETARAESDHSARSANLSLDEARHTIADLRTRLASADVRLARLPDIERRLDDALLNGDTLSEQVRDLTRKCEELSYACKDAERRADRGDSIVDVLRAKVDGMTGVRTRSTQAPLSNGVNTQTSNEEDTEKANGWQKKLARTVAGLTSESSVLDEMKAMGESAGLADWPVGALSGGENEAPSRADGLPPDGGFAGGAIVAKPEDVARLSPGQGEGAFSFSRNEFEPQRPYPVDSLESSLPNSDASSPEEPIIPPPPGGVTENTDSIEYGSTGLTRGPEVLEDQDYGSKYDPDVEVSQTDAITNNSQVLQDEGGESVVQDDPTSVNEPSESENPNGLIEDIETVSMNTRDNLEQITYLQQLERQSQKSQITQKLQEVELEENDAHLSGGAEQKGSNEDCNGLIVSEHESTKEGAVTQDEICSNESFGLSMEKPDTTIEIKPGAEEPSIASEKGSPKEFQEGEQLRTYNVENGTGEVENLVHDGPDRDERDNIKHPDEKLDCDDRPVDESSGEEEVGEWRSVSGESEYPVHETVTDGEDEPRSVEEVIKDAENLVKRARRRGLSLVDADRIFFQAHAKLESLLDRLDDDSSDRSRVEGALGSCLVSWVKVDIANEEASSRLERAILLLERRVEQAKDDATALFNAGLCLCLFAANGKIEDARECYERACEFYDQLLVVEPQSRIGFFNCGLAYISWGRIAVSAEENDELCKEIFQKAVERFEKSLELRPGDGKALSYLEESQKQLIFLQG